MQENQLELTKKLRKPIRNNHKMTKSKAQTLFDQLETFLISNTAKYLPKIIIFDKIAKKDSLSGVFAMQQLPKQYRILNVYTCTYSSHSPSMALCTWNHRDFYTYASFT